MENTREMKSVMQEAVRAEFKNQQKKATRNVLIVYAVAGGAYALSKLAQKTGADKKIKWALKEFTDGFKQGFKNGYQRAINK